MTDYTGFGTGTPSGLTWQNDNGAYTFGQRFRVDTSGLSATKIRFYIPSGSPAAPTSGYEVALYEVGNTTPVATAGPATATVGAWNEVAITPTTLTSGADYVAAVLYPGGYYGADTSLFSGGDYDPAGPIYFYTFGTYNAGSSLGYPNTSFGTPWYGVDVTVSDGGSSDQDGAGTAASGATTASGTGTYTITGSGTAASGATTASGSTSTPNTGSGTAASGATTAHGTGTGPLPGFATDRAELVQVLADLGLVGLAYPSGTPAQGQAWPLLGPIEFTPYGAATWRAVVVAGGDGWTAEAWLDTNLVAVRAALSRFMYVDSATPVDLGNGLLGIEFAGRREIR